MLGESVDRLALQSDRCTITNLTLRHSQPSRRSLVSDLERCGQNWSSPPWWASISPSWTILTSVLVPRLQQSAIVRRGTIPVLGLSRLSALPTYPEPRLPGSSPQHATALPRSARPLHLLRLTQPICSSRGNGTLSLSAQATSVYHGADQRSNQTLKNLGG